MGTFYVAVQVMVRRTFRKGRRLRRLCRLIDTLYFFTLPRGYKLLSIGWIWHFITFRLRNVLIWHLSFWLLISFRWLILGHLSFRLWIWHLSFRLWWIEIGLSLILLIRYFKTLILFAICCCRRFLFICIRRPNTTPPFITVIIELVRLLLIGWVLATRNKLLPPNAIRGFRLVAPHSLLPHRLF